MTKKDEKLLAQDLIMHQISAIGYGGSYEEYVKAVGSQAEADKVLMEQMNRIAKMFGFERAWFS